MNEVKRLEQLINDMVSDQAEVNASMQDRMWICLMIASVSLALSGVLIVLWNMQP